MKNIALLLMLIAISGAAAAKNSQGQAKHEAAENKAWTVPGGASKGVRACHNDIESFCKNVKPGQGRLGKCLKKNSTKLSTPCQAWLAHGGAGHVDRAFSEIDESTSAAKKPQTSKP